MCTAVVSTNDHRIKGSTGRHVVNVALSAFDYVHQLQARVSRRADATYSNTLASEKCGPSPVAGPELRQVHRRTGSSKNIVELQDERPADYPEL